MCYKTKKFDFRKEVAYLKRAEGFAILFPIGILILQNGVFRPCFWCQISNVFIIEIKERNCKTKKI